MNNHSTITTLRASNSLVVRRAADIIENQNRRIANLKILYRGWQKEAETAFARVQELLKDVENFKNNETDSYRDRLKNRLIEIEKEINERRETYQRASDNLIIYEARVLELETLFEEMLNYKGNASNALEDTFLVERARTTLKEKWR